MDDDPTIAGENSRRRNQEHSNTARTWYLDRDRGRKDNADDNRRAVLSIPRNTTLVRPRKSRLGELVSHVIGTDNDRRRWNMNRHWNPSVFRHGGRHFLDGRPENIHAGRLLHVDTTQIFTWQVLLRFFHRCGKGDWQVNRSRTSSNSHIAEVLPFVSSGSMESGNDVGLCSRRNRRHFLAEKRLPLLYRHCRGWGFYWYIQNASCDHQISTNIFQRISDDSRRGIIAAKDVTFIDLCRSAFVFGHVREISRSKFRKTFFARIRWSNLEFSLPTPQIRIAGMACLCTIVISLGSISRMSVWLMSM